MPLRISQPKPYYYRTNGKMFTARIKLHRYFNKHTCEHRREHAQRCSLIDLIGAIKNNESLRLKESLTEFRLRVLPKDHVDTGDTEMHVLQRAHVNAYASIGIAFFNISSNYSKNGDLQRAMHGECARSIAYISDGAFSSSSARQLGPAAISEYREFPPCTFRCSR